MKFAQIQVTTKIKMIIYMYNLISFTINCKSNDTVWVEVNVYVCSGYSIIDIFTYCCNEIITIFKYNYVQIFLGVYSLFIPIFTWIRHLEKKIWFVSIIFEQPSYAKVAKVQMNMKSQWLCLKILILLTYFFFICH